MENNLKDVFISYSRLDKEDVLKIYALLQKRGIQCFLDAIDIGAEDFLEICAKRILESRVFLFIGSSHAYQANYAPDEITFAKSNKPKDSIIVYKLTEEKMPLGLQLAFSSINQFSYPTCSFEEFAALVEKKVSKNKFLQRTFVSAVSFNSIDNTSCVNEDDVLFISDTGVITHHWNKSYGVYLHRGNLIIEIQPSSKFLVISKSGDSYTHDYSQARMNLCKKYGALEFIPIGYFEDTLYFIDEERHKLWDDKGNIVLNLPNELHILRMANTPGYIITYRRNSYSNENVYGLYNVISGDEILACEYDLEYASENIYLWGTPLYDKDADGVFEIGCRCLNFDTKWTAKSWEVKYVPRYYSVYRKAWSQHKAGVYSRDNDGIWVSDKIVVPIPNNENLFLGPHVKWENYNIVREPQDYYCSEERIFLLKTESNSGKYQSIIIRDFAGNIIRELNHDGKQAFVPLSKYAYGIAIVIRYYISQLELLREFGYLDLLGNYVSIGNIPNIHIPSSGENLFSIDVDVFSKEKIWIKYGEFEYLIDVTGRIILGGERQIIRKIDDEYVMIGKYNTDKQRFCYGVCTHTGECILPPVYYHMFLPFTIYE